MSIETTIMLLLSFGGLCLAIAIESNRRAIKGLKRYVLLVDEELEEMQE